MPSYKIESPIKYQGRAVKEGRVDMEESEAAPLIKSGSLSLIPELSGQGNENKIPPAGAVDQAPPGDADQSMPPGEDENESSGDGFISLVDAIGKLDPEDAALWSKTNGAPKVDALSAAAEREVSAAERDEAWAAYQAQQASVEESAPEGAE